MSEYVNVKNTTILVLTLSYFSVLAYLAYVDFYSSINYDSAAENKAFNSIKHSLKPLGLYSSWHYFRSPLTTQPYMVIRFSGENFSVEYVPEFQTGSIQIRTKHERKWYENIIRPDLEGVRNNHLKYLCSKFENETQRNFTEVTLYLYRKSIRGVNYEPEFREDNKWSTEC